MIQLNVYINLFHDLSLLEPMMTSISIHNGVTWPGLDIKDCSLAKDMWNFKKFAKGQVGIPYLSGWTSRNLELQT